MQQMQQYWTQLRWLSSDTVLAAFDSEQLGRAPELPLFLETGTACSTRPCEYFLKYPMVHRRHRYSFTNIRSMISLSGGLGYVELALMSQLSSMR